MPWWSFLAVGVAGGFALIGGLSQYNDDSPCCDTALVVLIRVAIGLCVVLAFMTGLAFGQASHPRSGGRRGGSGD
jgi:hypothetical protein